MSMMQDYMEVPGCNYIGCREEKIWNTKTGKEIKGRNITIRLADGNRYCFTRGKIIYSAVNCIHPLQIKKNLRINANGKAVDRYEFYTLHKRCSVINRYPANLNDYRNLLDCVENNRPPTFVFEFLEEVKSYCMKHLRVPADEAQDLTMYVLTDFCDKVENKLFPRSLVGYLQGSARKALASRRRSNKIFVELKDA